MRGKYRIFLPGAIGNSCLYHQQASKTQSFASSSPPSYSHAIVWPSGSCSPGGPADTSVTRAPWLGSRGDLNEYCHSEFTRFPQVPKSLGPKGSQKPANPATPPLVLQSQILPLATNTVLGVDYIFWLCLIYALT